MSSSRGEFRPDRFHPVDDRILLSRPMSVEVDWGRYLRSIERKRQLARTISRHLPDRLNRQLTFSSFRLEGIDVTETDLDDACTPKPSTRRSFASRQRQRLRNHMAIQLSIVRSLANREVFRVSQVIRWYTSVSAGLSTSGLDLAGMQRIESVIRRINSPQMRLQPALTEIAELHAELIADPVFPGFNGILVRLLLQSHLGKCGLPMIAFDPVIDAPRIHDPVLLLPRLLELIDTSFDRLINH